MGKLKYFLYFIVTVLTAIIYYRKSNTPNVEVPLIRAPTGDLSGYPQYTRKGRILHAYKGIPFVQPPVGKLRFKRPVPYENKAWKGTFEAINDVKKCVQFNLFGYADGTEDCLQLNVYVPRLEKLEKLEKLPVMVWFFGGGLQLGDASQEFYGPGNLLDKDVILVIPNYRLNIFGFFVCSSCICCT